MNLVELSSFGIVYCSNKAKLGYISIMTTISSLSKMQISTFKNKHSVLLNEKEMDNMWTRNMYTGPGEAHTPDPVVECTLDPVAAHTPDQAEECTRGPAEVHTPDRVEDYILAQAGARILDRVVAHILDPVGDYTLDQAVDYTLGQVAECTRGQIQIRLKLYFHLGRCLQKNYVKLV